MKQLFTLFLAVWAVTAQAQIPNSLTPEEKIYGLSKFWQEVNYNFVFLEKIDRVRWDSAYKATICSVLKSENDYQYYRELQKFAVLLGDGHTGISLPRGLDSLIMNTTFGKYRLFLSNIEDKAVVARINPGIRNEIPIGSEVVEVNGLKTDDYLTRYVYPYVESSTDYARRDVGVARLLSGLQGQTFRITIETPDHQTKRLSLTHGKTADTAVIPPPKKHDLLELKWYDPGIAYLALNSFNDQKIDTLFTRKLSDLYRAKGLIIDLRENRGGSSSVGLRIFEYLTNDSLVYGTRDFTRKHIAAYKAWGRFFTAKDTAGQPWAKKSFLFAQDKMYDSLEFAPEPNEVTEKRVVVPTVILIGHTTGSAAEDFLIYTANQKHMIRMGENSNGSTGQPLFFELPGGGRARVCTKKCEYPDGREFVGFGIKPEIEVRQTIKDWISGNDAVLTKAIEYLKREMK